MPGFLDNGAGDGVVVRKGGEGCFIGNKDPQLFSVAVLLLFPTLLS